jgi:hypothetical protein
VLDKFRVNGFRGLEKVAVENLSLFNLIIGPNNSGKTSFLEALQLYAAPLDFRAFLAILSQRGAGLHPNAFFITEQLRWFFKAQKNNETFKAEISGQTAGYSREIKLSYWASNNDKSVIRPPGNFAQQMIFGGPPGTRVEALDSGVLLGQVEIDLDQQQKNPVKKNVKINFPAAGPLVFPGDGLDCTIPSDFIEPSPQKNLEAGIEKISTIIRTGVKGRYLSLMKAIDPNIDDVQILLTNDGSPHVVLNHQTLGLTPLSIHGDGLRRASFLAGAVAQASGGLVLIDELENAIHFRGLSEIIRVLISWLQENNTQVFATTHSLECIDALATASQANPELFSLFYFSKNADGTQLKRLSGNDVIRVRQELGSDVRMFT